MPIQHFTDFTCDTVTTGTGNNVLVGPKRLGHTRQIALTIHNSGTAALVYSIGFSPLSDSLFVTATGGTLAAGATAQHKVSQQNFFYMRVLASSTATFAGSNARVIMTNNKEFQNT